VAVVNAKVASYDPYALIGDVIFTLTRAGIDCRFTGAEAEAAVRAASQLLAALGVLVVRSDPDTAEDADR
jgi:hypothetical protein